MNIGAEDASRASLVRRGADCGSRAEPGGGPGPAGSSGGHGNPLKTGGKPWENMGKRHGNFRILEVLNWGKVHQKWESGGGKFSQFCSNAETKISHRGDLSEKNGGIMGIEYEWGMLSSSYVRSGLMNV